VSKSQGLRLADVRAAFRLVGECRELGDDATQWRRHMAAGLCRLTGGQLAFGGEARVIEPDGLMAAVHFGDHGWPSAATRWFYLAWLKDPRVLDTPPSAGSACCRANASPAPASNSSTTARTTPRRSSTR
jgi:hypothetical protein